MIDLTSYENYFKKEIFEKYPKLKAFHHIDLFERDTFFNALRDGKFKTPLLILETFDTGTLANGLYNINDILDGSILVINRFDVKQLNSEIKTTFLSECYDIVKQIRAKMILDKRSSPCNILHGLDVNSMEISRSETLAGTFQGFGLSFKIENDIEIQLSNDWL